ncbi:MAG: flotillin family protein [Gemmataceae bacterium]|nr:flotillin family protein [Gemmataceae bacterium]
MSSFSLFAQLDQAASRTSGRPEWLPTALIIVAATLVILSFFLLLARRYKRCPSNRVLVVYGKVRGQHASRCIHGGAAFVVPLLQDYSFLSLEPIQIEVPLKGALSIENIRVNVPSVFTVAVGTEPEVMQNAAIRLLGLTNQDIRQQASDIIFGQLRQVIASMKIEDINRDRDKFLQNIQTSLEPELRKIGLVLINVNITDITDESGYIEAIGRKAASTAVQQAKIDVAEQEKLGQIGVAEAEREKAVQVANAVKVREIGTREALREQAVRIAQLDREQKVAEQSAALERDAQIKDTERKTRIAVADANAKAITGEAAAQAEVVAAQAQLQVRQAEAYQVGETRKREAEAAVQEAQNRALAKAALAQAERVEAERRAAVEAPAKAERARILVEAEAEAGRRRIEAEAQAAALYAKLEAEARGQYELLAKKGDGLRRIIEACGGAQQAFQLLMLEHLDTLAQTAAQAIANIKFDKVIVWENGGGNGDGASNTARFLQNMARTMPPMLQIMKDIGGVELPEFIARLTPEAMNGSRPTEVPDSLAERMGGAKPTAETPEVTVPLPRKG